MKNDVSNCDWIAPPEWDLDAQPRPTWWLRRCFLLDEIPKALSIDVVCLGYYELYVNGHLVSDEPLAPSVSKLDKRAFRISHDVARFLQEGENCIGIWCSSAWYLPHQFTVHENATPLIGCCCDGKMEFVGGWLCRASNRSITGGWKWDDFGGEDVDAGSYVAEWNLAGCDVSGWEPVREVTPPPVKVSERRCPPNRIGEVYKAKSIRKLDDGRFEVDFGVCLSGWGDIPLAMLKTGESVELRFYDLPADNDRKKDHSYKQVSVYRAIGDGRDRFTNKFNYAGFRYMTIGGLSTEPPIDGMRAMLVESAMDQVGHFSCSNELYNRIHDMNLQTLRCLNLGGYSVDCPHRERNGYGADGQTAMPGYLYLLDSKDFLRKWLTDWCDVYEPDTGRISLCAPTHHDQHAPPWGGIVAPLAWALYVYYGDRAALDEAAPVILGHLRWLQESVSDGVLRKDLLGSAFHADWVSVGRGMDSEEGVDQPMRELFNSCYLIYVWEICAKICRVLGDERDLAEIEENIAVMREGVHREFYDAGRGLYLMPGQAYQAMPLLAGVVPDELRDGVKAKLVGLIEEEGWHFDTGLPGTTLLLDLLMDMGANDVIGKVFAQDTYPGWGYMVAQGATTIWEQWNGFWSQIHSCFAGPAAWFYAGLAGIRPDESGPGFEKFMLSPAFLEAVDYVEASYESPAGRIESSWKREKGKVLWHVEVPIGSTATVEILGSQEGPELAGGSHDLVWDEAAAEWV